MHTGGEVVCALRMPLRSSRFVCPENQPWPKEIFEARYELRVDEVKSVSKDCLDYWAERRGRTAVHAMNQCPAVSLLS